MSLRESLDLLVQVRWSDMDPLGHVNSSQFLSYCELARVQLLTELDVQEFVVSSRECFVLEKTTCRFFRSIKYPESNVQILTNIEGVEETEALFAHKILSNPANQPVANVEALLRWTDIEAGRPMPIQRRVRDALSSLLTLSCSSTDLDTGE